MFSGLRVYGLQAERPRRNINLRFGSLLIRGPLFGSEEWSESVAVGLTGSHEGAEELPLLSISILHYAPKHPVLSIKPIYI